jgi:hypothetical protein
MKLTLSQAHRLGLRLQLGLARAIAQQQEVEALALALGLQRRRGFEQRFQRVRHAVGADVAGHEAPLQAQPLASAPRPWARREAVDVHAVGHHVDLLGVDAALGQLLA